MHKTFRGDSDYKTAFERAATCLIDGKIEDRSERISAVEALINEYVDAVGERPDSRVLSLLTDEILREELTDDNPYKVAHNEYPFLSETQYRRRTEGKFERRTDASGNLRPMNREVPLNLAMNVGADGRDYRVPTRRELSVNEIIDKETAVKEGGRHH